MEALYSSRSRRPVARQRPLFYFLYSREPRWTSGIPSSHAQHKERFRFYARHQRSSRSRSYGQLTGNGGDVADPKVCGGKARKPRKEKQKSQSGRRVQTLTRRIFKNSATRGRAGQLKDREKKLIYTNGSVNQRLQNWFLA